MGLRMNINHPTFIAFIETINKNILSNISVDKYFSLPKEKKIGVQYIVLKHIVKTVKVRGNLTNSELSDFTKILQKKNEILENYEFAGVLSDISTNFDTLIEMGQSGGLRPKKPIRTDSSTDSQLL